MARTKHIAPAKAGCLLRIKSAIEMFKPAEKAVAYYVLSHPEQVMNMSVSEAARDIEVGESTVIRFCRALGYKGYQEFRLRLAQDLVEPVEFIHENITFADSSAELAQKVFQTNIKAVGDTMKAVDPQMVEVAAKALADAGRVDIYGVGYSSFTALDAKLKFVRLGLTADAYGDAHLQAMADVVLLTASPESPLGGEVLTSRIAQLCVLDVLSVALAVTLGEGCLDLIKKTSEAVKKKRY
ncbi:MAG: MurR/RpiR family transcriptional regulator [Acidobacteria bacterium]|nr:MurR/RpiR family transcriptional regulator [Acidobacteriota bacterium]